jgi:hypothetical protein
VEVDTASTLEHKQDAAKVERAKLPPRLPGDAGFRLFGAGAAAGGGGAGGAGKKSRYTGLTVPAIRRALQRLLAPRMPAACPHCKRVLRTPIRT